ncbi:hypothetical protein K3495_g6523 [Podosphaera aphanis]|nr:hypothetical protein K3495_g6523 [Podosphaera aphanis]
MSLRSIDPHARKRHVFASVFNDSQLSPNRQVDNSKTVENTGNLSHQVEWNASWHLVTKTLSLPKLYGDHGILSRSSRLDKRSNDSRFQNALKVLLCHRDLRLLAIKTQDIVAWYSVHVRQHFLNQVLPVIRQLPARHEPEFVLLQCTKILEASRYQYHDGFSLLTTQIDAIAPGTASPTTSRFRRDLDALTNNTVMDMLAVPLKTFLKQQVSIILGLPLPTHETTSLEGRGLETARHTILRLVNALKNLGLAGERFQVIFAEIMDHAMSDYIYWRCRSNFSTTDSSMNCLGAHVEEAASSYPSHCVKAIGEWVGNQYSTLVAEVLNLLDDTNTVPGSEREKFKEICISRLVELRITELFDVVEHWPHGGRALDDLRTAITTPQRRLHLTEAFSQVLARKILHPAASTTRILQTYIAMIWSFHSLDHSKVLLDRVAYPLQLYLCTREDTVRIIITNLLADPEDAATSGIMGGEKLTELARLLSHGPESFGQRADDKELDWHDMDWLPDPVDAGPGYKRSKYADVIGTLIGVLGSQELFVKEFQNIIGENFLKYDGAFTKEIKVLELLKVRFGEAPVQACEVMLKDIKDSEKVDVAIRRTQKLTPSKLEIQTAKKLATRQGTTIDSEGLLKPSLHSKILSRIFWPQLNAESFRVPDVISELQKRYEEGFEELKSARKLTWLNALGQATVELEFEDRSLVEKVHTWQAAVIWAFQSDKSDGNGEQRTVRKLVEDLEMEETLVRSAVRFWVKKFVLYEVSANTYAVLETVCQEDQVRSHAQTGLSAAAGDNDDENLDEVMSEAEHGMMAEKTGIYWQFILGMLTNSSSQMPLQQIGMMLRMLISDGFPYSDDELRDFLGQKVTDGELELVGEKYQLKK